MTAAEQEPDPWQAHAAAASETVAGGMALLATALGMLGGAREEAAASADTARQALAPLAPLLDGLGSSAHAECRSCPVCRLLALARMASPELVDGLGDALDAALAALRDELGRQPES